MTAGSIYECWDEEQVDYLISEENDGEEGEEKDEGEKLGGHRWRNQGGQGGHGPPRFLDLCLAPQISLNLT